MVRRVDRRREASPWRSRLRADNSGQHSADVDDAYDRYIDFLEAIYQPGRLAPPIPPLQEEDLPSSSLPELPVSGGADVALP